MLFDQLVPGVRGMHVHLDHAGIGRDLEHVEARVARRRLAFHDDRQALDPRGVFDARRQGRDNPRLSSPAA